jgi:hypothetical protein
MAVALSQIRAARNQEELNRLLAEADAEHVLPAAEIQAAADERDEDLILWGVQ